MNRNELVIHSDPEIMGGTPVFVGTRVPLATLLDYLEAGQPLSEFLEDFPTVTREQAVAALEQAKEALLARARQAPASARPCRHTSTSVTVPAFTVARASRIRGTNGRRSSMPLLGQLVPRATRGKPREGYPPSCPP